jgi:hypothetical protein
MPRSCQGAWQADPVAVLGVDGRTVRLLALPDVAAVLAVSDVAMIVGDGTRDRRGRPLRICL